MQHAHKRVEDYYQSGRANEMMRFAKLNTDCGCKDHDTSAVGYGGIVRRNYGAWLQGCTWAGLGWVWPKPKPEPHKVLWVESSKITTRYNIGPGWVNPLISGLDWVV